MKKIWLCHDFKLRKYKIPIKMKLTSLLIFITVSSCFAFNSYSQVTKISLEVENTTISEILRKIEDQSEFRFFYSSSVDVQQSKTISKKNEKIFEVLDELFSGTSIKYEVFDRQIALFTVQEKITFLQQFLTVKGKVTDPSGEPLPGVTILIKGTYEGGITDVDGNFQIVNVPEDAILVFSSMGYETQEIPVNGLTTINVVMSETRIGLEEVVAIGYGTMKKTDLTGSIGSIDNEKLTGKGVTSPLEAMQGEVAGVNVYSTNGRAGSDFEVIIRGNNSLVEGNPLYVVDGLVTGNIQFLNPQDIKRIDVLKDASSTAIYGSRGSNGVVIITTNQASESDGQNSTISYNGYYGVRTPARLPDLMDGDEYWEYRQNAYLGAEFYSGNDLTDTTYNQAWLNARTGYDASEVLRNIVDNKDYCDWYDLMLKNGSQQNHWLSISGSGQDMSYLFGIGYQKEDGVFENEWYERYNMKSSINHKISEKWLAGINTNIALSEAEIGEDRNTNVYDAFNLPPVLAPYIPEGYENAGGLSVYPSTDYEMGINGAINPLISIQNLKNNTRTLYVTGNVFLQYSLVKDLNIKTTFSPYIEIEKEGTYQGSETGQRALQDPAASTLIHDYMTWAWDNQISYKKDMNDHHFDVMALYSMSYSRMEPLEILVENLPFYSLWYNLGSATDLVNGDTDYIKSTLKSFLGRINYSYKDKYLLTASFRADGSSKLAIPWDNFPSIALAWKLSEESFLKDVKSLSILKLRASYGYTGNNNIAAYSTAQYASTQSYYEFGGVTANGFIPSNIANEALTWEKTREFNLGLDFGLLKNRISGSIDVYDKLSTELLLDQKLALETGWGSVTANIGSVSNKGIEILLNTTNISTPDFSWKTTFSFTRNINAIEELYGDDEDDLGNLWFIGQPVNVNYSYVFDGIWQADEAEEAATYGQLEGQARVADLDTSGTINSLDRTIIGTPDPSWFGSFSTSLRYKNFDLNISVFTQQGVQVYSEFHNTYAKPDERWRNKLDLNYYMVENNVTEARISNEYPMPKNSGIYWGLDNCGFFKDASFVKIKNITLGYTFNPERSKKADIKSLRVYVNILNPFVFSEFDGFDPEWAGRSRYGGGVSTITYQIGVNANF